MGTKNRKIRRAVGMGKCAENKIQEQERSSS